mgnify:CR=1 FL=1
MNFNSLLIGSEDPACFGEDPALPGSEIDRAVGDDDIGRIGCLGNQHHLEPERCAHLLHLTGDLGICRVRRPLIPQRHVVPEELFAYLERDGVHCVEVL